MKNNAEMMKRHLGKGGFVELVGDDNTTDKIYMPLVCIEDSPDYVMLATKLSEMNEGDDIMSILTTDDINVIHRILINILLGSVDGLTREDIGSFVVSNFMPLMAKMFELNRLGADSMSQKDTDRIKAIQDRVKNATDAKLA